VTFAFLILDFNTFYFMEDLPENHVHCIYVTGASSLKIVFIIYYYIMRENNDRTFAKSQILVRKVTGDMVILSRRAPYNLK